MSKSLARALGAMALILGLAASVAVADGGGTGTSTTTTSTTPTMTTSTTPTTTTSTTPTSTTPTTTTSTTPTTTTSTTPASTALPATGTLGPAGLITLTSALVSGTIDTHGSDVQWSFAFGTDTSYGGGYDDNAPHLTPKASSPVAISAPLSDLQPNTTYHYRLLMTVIGAGTSVAQTSSSADGVFTTGNFGQLQVQKTELGVGRFSHQVLLPLKCAGKFEPCQGKLAVTIRQGDMELACATRAYRVAEKSVTTVRFQLSRSCLDQIAATRTGRRGATLVAESSNGQPRLRQALQLRLPVTKQAGKHRRAAAKHRR